jgi:putative oxidoreductase
MSSTGVTTTVPRTTALHVALWIVQLLLAVAFGMAGVMKSTQPIANLAAAMGWPGDVPAALVRFIGVSELAGAIGLVLPTATRIRPLLTPLAALGLVVVMVLAMMFHVSRGEWQALPFNAVLGGLAAFVAWGRLRKVAILPRA